MRVNAVGLKRESAEWSMDDKMHYQKQIKLLTNLDVLDILAESIDEKSVGSEDFKVLQDFVSKRKLLKESYVNKIKYEDDHYFWLRSCVANLTIKEITTELNMFCKENSFILERLVAFGHSMLENQGMRNDDTTSDEIDEQEIDEIQPIESPLFDKLLATLRRGLDVYCERECNAVLFAFRDALFESLNSFANGLEGLDFDFSVSYRDESGIEYIDFHFEKNLLEVTSGGITIDRSVGSDSYTNWQYSIWNDGTEDSCYITVDRFNIILEMFIDPNIKLSISTPDEFYYTSEPEEEDEEEWNEEGSLEAYDQDIMQINMFDT